MMKSSHLYLGLAAMLLLPAAVIAQDNAAATAVTEAVKRQHDTIVLRQKIAEARGAMVRKDTAAAAKLYQESLSLAQEIGRAGIEAETQQAVSGLVSSSLALAEEAQGRQDYGEADTRVKQALKADPKSQVVLEFKRQNDALIEANRGKLPSPAVMDQAPAIQNQKKMAAQLVQDGKFFYEMGKLDEADKKLTEAVKLDPDNTGAYYYQLLLKQARYKRESAQHLETLQEQMNNVEKRWVLPTATADLPKQSNPYATNTLVYTGPGRQAIMERLNRIYFPDAVSFDGPLNSVLDDLSKLSKLRDPEKRGINFMINPNPDQSGPPIAAAGGGGLGGGLGGENFQAAAPQPVAQPPAIDPTTGQIIPPTTGGNAGAEKVDIATAVTVKLNLSNVRLADVLDAIVETAEHPEGHPIKFSIKEYGIVFQDKGAENPLLFTRFFKIDPNTFYSGLEGVSAQSFGTVDSTGGGGGGGGGGGSRGGGGGGSSQNQSAAVVGVVNAIPGAGSARQSGGGGGRGGGGGGGTTGSASNPLNGAGGAGGGGVNGGDGGLRFVSQVNLTADVSIAARSFFTALGVNLTQPAGKSVFFNDKTGYLMVRATEQDLDTIEKAIQILNQAAPQIHIKTRFIEVAQDDSKQFGLDWYLGQFQVGHNVAGTGGSSPSLNVPTSAANPLGAFPGNTAANLISGAATDQLLTGGLRNSGPVLGTLTGILTDPNFRVVLHALEQRGGTENLGEPEVVTTSGRQAQMKATEVRTVVVDLNFQQGNNNINTGGNGGGTTGGGTGN